MGSNNDDSSSSALTALAAAASIARSDASSAGTPRQDSDNSSISSNTTKYDFTCSNDDATANGPVITKAKSGNISNGESAKAIGSLLKKADAASNRASQKRKSQNYSSSDTDSDKDDDDESEDFLISRIPKPKRPMTAYNFFFQAERKKIIRDEKEASNNAKNSSSSSSSGTRRRSKGKASNHQAFFENMGKTIGRRWKEVSKEDLERYQALGTKESRRYKREMKVYTAKVASIRAKKSLGAEAKKMRREYHPGTRKAPSSVHSTTDTNTTATLSTIGAVAQSDRGDPLTSFINSLSHDQLKKLLSLRVNERKRVEQASALQPSSAPQSTLAQSINRLQNAAILSAAPPASLPPASSSQSQSIGLLERALIQSQGQMIAQLQSQIQALQRRQLSQTSLSPSLLHQQQQPLLHHHQQQQIPQMWSTNVNSVAGLPTSAPLHHAMGNDASRLTAALSSRYTGKLAGQQQQQQQQQQANIFNGNAALGNNAASLFFGL